MHVDHAVHAVLGSGSDVGVHLVQVALVNVASRGFHPRPGDQQADHAEAVGRHLGPVRIAHRDGGVQLGNALPVLAQRVDVGAAQQHIPILGVDDAAIRRCRQRQQPEGVGRFVGRSSRSRFLSNGDDGESSRQRQRQRNRNRGAWPAACLPVLWSCGLHRFPRSHNRPVGRPALWCGHVEHIVRQRLCVLVRRALAARRRPCLKTGGDQVPARYGRKNALP